MHEGSTGTVLIEEASSREVFEEASSLYAEVFGYRRAEAALNPLLLRAMVANGGTAVAAFDGDRLVGFSYGFPGHDGDAWYAYSQATFVSRTHQGVGLGRRLKHGQKAQALSLGFGEMRWAFDPLLGRNAYFNLEVLRARGIRVVSDFYGTSGTDRMVVAWNL